MTTTEIIELAIWRSLEIDDPERAKYAAEMIVAFLAERGFVIKTAGEGK